VCSIHLTGLYILPCTWYKCPHCLTKVNYFFLLCLTARWIRERIYASHPYGILTRVATCYIWSLLCPSSKICASQFYSFPNKVKFVIIISWFRFYSLTASQFINSFPKTFVKYLCVLYFNCVTQSSCVGNRIPNVIVLKCGNFQWWLDYVGSAFHNCHCDRSGSVPNLRMSLVPSPAILFLLP
jgi:hypothetical protein